MIAHPATPDATDNAAPSAVATVAAPAVVVLEPARVLAIEPVALRTADAARLCGMSPTKWLLLDRAGKIPRAIRLRGTKFWRVAELRDWWDADCPPRKKWKWERMSPDAAKSPDAAGAEPARQTDAHVEQQQRIEAQDKARLQKQERDRGKQDALAEHRRRQRQKTAAVVPIEAATSIL